MKKAYISNQNIMDIWNYILDHKVYNGNFEIRWRRTNESFCQNLYHNNKSVGCIYVFGLREYSDGNIHGYVARVYVNPKYRNTGMAFAMMKDVIDNFGNCVLHISSASPNRIKDLNDDNREYYRNKLYKFYEHFGFRRTSKIHTGMIRDKDK